MVWNRELAGLIVAIVMLATFIFLIVKRNSLDRGGNYLIAAIALLTTIDIYSSLQKAIHFKYNSSFLYVIGINLVVFLLFFLYFHSVLESKKLKRINAILIVLFLLGYAASALYVDKFFSEFPFFSYFVEVVLLTGSIYMVMSQTFNSDRILSLGNYFPFWVCIGLLVIYLGVLPLLIISNTATHLMNLNIFFAILFFVNIIGYSILLIGILKAKPEIKVDPR